MSSQLRVALLHSVIRREEKLLLDAFTRLGGVEVTCLDDRKLGFDPAGDAPPLPYDAVLARSVSFSRGLYARYLFESRGLRCFNEAAVAALCGDKLRMSLALLEAGVPHPDLRIAFTQDSALEAANAMGYPVVMKPVVGSWGRLIARADDADAAESLLEHKAALGNYQHQIYYLQRYVDKGGDKGGRDIRSFVVGGRCIAAIARTSAHWRTNTARGATASNCPVSDELASISLQATRAVGGGMLAIDLFETKDADGGDGYIVNEVNDTMEFKNSIETTGVDIPLAMAEHVVEELRGRRAA